ncbi:MAG TPA: hypothetical protein VGE16_02705 [Albitalea sp.]
MLGSGSIIAASSEARSKASESVGRSAGPQAVTAAPAISVAIATVA